MTCQTDGTDGTSIVLRSVPPACRAVVQFSLEIPAEGAGATVSPWPCWRLRSRKGSPSAPEAEGRSAQIATTVRSYGKHKTAWCQLWCQPVCTLTRTRISHLPNRRRDVTAARQFRRKEKRGCDTSGPAPRLPAGCCVRSRPLRDVRWQRLAATASGNRIVAHPRPRRRCVS